MAKTKKITLEHLATLIEAVGKKSNQALKKVDYLSGQVNSLADQSDSLATKVDSLSGRMDSSAQKIRQDIDSLAIITKRSFDNTNDKIEKIQTDFEFLKQGEEQIELRLTNVAYRLDLVNLQDRVQVLEEKLGIKSSK